MRPSIRFVSVLAVALVLTAGTGAVDASPRGAWPPKTSLRARVRGLRPTLALLRHTLTRSLRMSRDARRWRVRDARRGAPSRQEHLARQRDIDARLEAFGKTVVRDARIRLEVEGAEHLGELTGGAIIIANHESHLDGPILLSLMDLLGPTRVAGSQHLFEVPVLGKALEGAGVISIDRKNTGNAVEALTRAARELGPDTNLLIVPEGGRGRGAPLPLKKGAFHQARNMNRPILPIRLEGAGAVLPADGTLVQPGRRVRVVIGRPINGNDVEELKARSEAFFASQGVHFPAAKR